MADRQHLPAPLAQAVLGEHDLLCRILGLGLTRRWAALIADTSKAFHHAVRAVSQAKGFQPRVLVADSKAFRVLELDVAAGGRCPAWPLAVQAPHTSRTCAQAVYTALCTRQRRRPSACTCRCGRAWQEADAPWASTLAEGATLDMSPCPDALAACRGMPRSQAALGATTGSLASPSTPPQDTCSSTTTRKARSPPAAGCHETSA